MKLQKTLEIDINDEWLLQQVILDEPFLVDKLIISIPCKMQGLERIKILRRDFISPKVDAKFTSLVFSYIEDEFLKDFLEFFHDCHESGYLTVNEIRLHSFSVSILSMIVEYFGNSLNVFASLSVVEEKAWEKVLNYYMTFCTLLRVS